MKQNLPVQLKAMAARFITFLAMVVVTATISLHAQSQGGELKGTVLDTDGEPLVGATVTMLDKNKVLSVVATDINGEFTLKGASGKTLRVTYIGYEAATVEVGNQTSMNIVLVSNTQALDEVVVVGFGTQKKETLTGAISVVKSQSLIESPTPNISNALVGRVPGVSGVQSSGEPGDNATTLRVRGVATMNSEGNDPLIVIDGVQSTIEMMNAIDPNEIQSISVLKDASSTAVYGVKGANGVILVTTKRGDSGAPKINLSYRFGITEMASKLKMLDSYRYALLRNEAVDNDGDVSKAPYRFDDNELWKFQVGRDYTPDEIDAMNISDAQKAMLANSPALYYRNNDRYNEMFGGTSPTQQFNVNISGGTDRVKYFASIGYLDQTGLFDLAKFQNVDNNTKNQRYNFRSNVDIELHKTLTLSVDVNGSFTHNSGILGKDGDVSSASSRHKQMLVQVLSTSPFGAPGFIDGKLIGNYISDLNPLEGRGTGWTTPAYIMQCNLLDTRQSNVSTTVRLRHKMDYLTKGLSISGAVSYDDTYRKSRTEYREPQIYKVGRNPNNPNELLFFGGIAKPATVNDNVSSYNYKRNSLYLEAKVDYNRTFGLHNVTALALISASQQKNPSLAFLVPSGMIGSAGRLTYSFDNRYFAEFNVGYNGSENFRKGKRFGFFPAYSLGWILTNEHFFPRNDYVTYVKFRGSYGEVGNDKIGGNRFLYLPSSWSFNSSKNIDSGHGAYFGYTDGSALPAYYQGAYESRLGNPNVTWERAKKTNIGVELSFFKNRQLTVVADIFNEDRDDILWDLTTTPVVVGATPPKDNIGKMNNKGYEIQVTWTDWIRDFSYSVSAGVSYAKNTIKYMDEPENPYYWMNTTGYSYGQYKGYHSDGFYNNPEEAFNRPYVTKDGNKVQSGDIRYIDLNGDGVIDSKDEAPIGYSNLPRYTFNANVSLAWKGFSISALFTGACNGSMPINSFYMINPFYMDTGSAQTFHYDNRWTPEKVEAGITPTWPRASMRNLDSQNGLANDLYLQKTDYIKLKNLEIAYLYSGSLVKKIGLSSVRIYLSGNNLVTWSDMLPGFDPEQADTGGAKDGYLYPPTRSYNIGVNVSF